mgnify:CR=1 FL=1
MKLVESFPQITDDSKLLSVFQNTELIKIVVMQKWLKSCMQNYVNQCKSF